MHFVGGIDCGFDHEIQEIEEFVEQKKIPEFSWDSSVGSIPNLLVAAPGSASKLLLNLKEFRLKSSIINAETKESFADLFEFKNIHVILCKEMHGFQGFIAQQIVKLSPKTLAIIDIRPGSPNDTNAMSCFQTSHFPQKSWEITGKFKTIDGISAALLTLVLNINKLESQGKDGICFQFYQNGALESSLASVYDCISELFSIDFASLISKEMVQKTLFHPNNSSAMFI